MVHMSILTPPPRNLRLSGVDPDQLRMVEGDVYSIAARLAEISSNLFLVLHKDVAKPWVVMEHCADGEVRFVARYEQLDQRILKHVEYMKNVPFEKRLAVAEAEAAAANAEAKDAWWDTEQAEEFAWEFAKALDDANLGDDRPHRSYRPFRQVMRNRTAPLKHED